MLPCFRRLKAGHPFGKRHTFVDAIIKKKFTNGATYSCKNGKLLHRREQLFRAEIFPPAVFRIEKIAFLLVRKALEAAKMTMFRKSEIASGIQRDPRPQRWAKAI